MSEVSNPTVVSVAREKVISAALELASWTGGGDAQWHVRVGKVVTAATELHVLTEVRSAPDKTCGVKLGRRPSWMSLDQYDACRCDLRPEHDGPHHCEHGMFGG